MKIQEQRAEGPKPRLPFEESSRQKEGKQGLESLLLYKMLRFDFSVSLAGLSRAGWGMANLWAISGPRNHLVWPREGNCRQDSTFNKSKSLFHSNIARIALV